jgi:hypothetical protein
MVSIFWDGDRDGDRDRDGGMGKISHNPDLLLVRYVQYIKSLLHIIE